MGYKLVDCTPEQAKKAFDRHGTVSAAARALNVSRQTLRRRIEEAKDEHTLEVTRLRQQCSELKKELNRTRKEQLSEQEIRRYIVELSNEPVRPPDWLIQTGDTDHGTTGVPTLLLSDFHWSERVEPSEVFYRNEYGMDIASNRLHRIIERTSDLLLSHMVNPSYPGIVCALAGDMHSGDIHEELSETNEAPLMSAFVDLQEHLIWAIKTLADHFGRVFCPCVVGNHGRNTRKPKFKGRVYTNFDWLLYQQLEKWFENDDRVQFLVATGIDVQYRIYNHRYRLAHGDQFRGGWGFIGPYAPITRGETKKRSAADSYGAGYDTLLIGHFHQYMALHKVIVNGSLKGYDEYAIGNDFPFEPPRQALWMTHPKRGITFSMPVQADSPQEREEEEAWVSWKEEEEV